MAELSIVIPIYNSEKQIGSLIKKLHSDLKELSFDVVLVNDGSKDQSESVCTQLANEYDNVSFISLMKNFGEFNAVMCGLNFAKGDFVVIIDDDFQNPPSEILKLLNKAKEDDADVVYSYYAEKKHSAFRNWGSRLVNNLTTYLINKPHDLYLSSFKLMRQELVEHIIKFKSPYPYIDGIIFFLTNNVSKVMVDHHPRADGQSSYTLRKLISLFLTVLFGYSLMPIRLIMFTGVFSIFFSLVYMILYFTGAIPEWGSPVIIFLCGVLLCSLAIVGEYVGKTLLILSGVPQFVYRKKIIQKNADK
ncbi:undecaprenyl-phosphate 4-deoxy-4-formamido-L-arabinose transferase [Spirosomataceae bacterium TFI 002]|nr:undecaprenyl-phosphate 4-deoxy-4-formamido-L-arabinose transferase [Spirosomataceae bacterium TFI 002]